jgi:hypothetical protein
MSLIKKPNELMQSLKIKLKGLIYGQPGIGKSEPVNALVATPSGFRAIGSLEIGDSIFGRDGLSQEVVGVFPQGVRPTYKIITNDGGVCFADEEHIWLVRAVGGNSRKAGWKTMTTKQILEKGVESKLSEARKSSGRKPTFNFELPVCGALAYQPVEFVISPYILGVLIGDGSLSDGKCIFTNPDQEIVDRVKSEINRTHNLNEHKLGEEYCRRFAIVYNGEKKGDSWYNAYVREIRNLGLNVKSQFKFIPEIYKKGSIGQRISLLQGLMDTDGTAKGNRVSYSTISYRLAQDIVELVRSLGGISKIRSYNREDKIEFVVNIKLNECPFHVARKANEWKPSVISRYIARIEKATNEECVCIAVSNEDKLYITDDYIVTHNTSLALSAPKPLLIDFDNGLRRVDKQYQTDSVQIQSYQDLLDILTKEDILAYETIVIDTLGKMIDRIADWLAISNPKVKQADGQLSMKGWGNVKGEFQRLLKLLEGKNKSVIFIAHEKEEKVGDEVIKRPDVAGSSGKDIVKELDFMGYMSIKGGKRTIDLAPNEAYYAKNSLGLNSFLEYKPLAGVNNFLSEAIFDAYQEKLKKDEELAKDYDDLIEELKTKVANIKDLEQLSSYYTSVYNKHDKLWSSYQMEGSFLKAKVEELGCEFDAKTKEFKAKKNEVKGE